MVSTEAEFTFTAVEDRSLVAVFEYEDHYDIQDVLFLTDHIVSSGQTLCYDALQTVYLAGDNGFFIIENGAEAHVIAGNNIVFLPGTIIAEGAYLEALIRPNGPFCNGLLSQEEEMEFPEHKEVDDISDINELILPKKMFKIYPNPTDGDFTLEITYANENCKTEIEIFGLTGELLQKYSVTDHRNIFQLSLLGYKPGIYYVRVMICGQLDIKRIIKHP